MDAHIFIGRDGEWMVSLRVDGKEVDEAGPFDDQADAMLAAERCVYNDGIVTYG